MSVQINYKSNSVKQNSENLVLFVDETLNISGLKSYISTREYEYISDLIVATDKKKKIITYDISSKRKIILVSVKKKTTSSEIISIGS